MTRIGLWLRRNPFCLALVSLILISLYCVYYSYFGPLLQRQRATEQYSQTPYLVKAEEGAKGDKSSPNQFSSQHGDSVSSSNQGNSQPLGILTSRNAQGWSPVLCNVTRKLRSHSFSTPVGKMTFYIYDNFSQDTLLKDKFMHGEYFERNEIAKFLSVSRHLPLLDMGANVGLVTLQAAMQGRQVVAVEPIPENALRLCRSALDFGHGSLVHVIRNAVSSQEGNVRLAIGAKANARSQYQVSKSEGWGHDATTVYAIKADMLLDVLPFKRAALKIDVESYEGHALAGAEKLFQQVDIPIVWLEWEHVKSRTDYGGAFIISFMEKYNLHPYNIMNGQPLETKNYMKWPFTVLWKKSENASDV